MSTLHTPEPWTISGDSIMADLGEEIGEICICNIETDGGYEALPNDQTANKNRIVACVNSLSGLNPEALPRLLEAAKDMKDTILQFMEAYPGAESVAVTHYDEALEALRK